MSDFPFIVVANIIEAIQPVARGAKYEDPLNAELKRARAGAVTGAGTQLGERLQIASVDIELALADLEASLAFACEALARLGAPAGSRLLFLRDDRPRSLSIAPDAVESDCPEALAALERRLVLPEKTAPAPQPNSSIDATARKIMAAFERLKIGHPEVQTADLSASSVELLGWYDQVTGELAAAGFRELGNTVTVRSGEGGSMGGPGAFSRKFASADAAIRANVFQVTSAKGSRTVRSIGLHSEFDDEMVLSTNNHASPWNTPESFHVESLGDETAIEMLVARHRVRLDEFLHAHPERRLVTFGSLADVLESEARAKSLTAAFRRSQGIPTMDELTRLGVKSPLVGPVYQAMQRLSAGAASGSA
jgi:hypothetical protein